jgi:hypothetical protein
LSPRGFHRCGERIDFELPDHVSRRHKEHDPDLADDAARYVEMAERYRQAAIATFRAKRERSQS